MTWMRRVVITSCLISAIPASLHAVVIFTYKNPEAAALNSAEFSLTSDTIDNILIASRSDFVTDKILVPQSAPATPGKASLSPEDGMTYHQYYKQMITQPSDKRELNHDNFNLSSGGAFQPSYLPSDFTLVTEVFKQDPQLNYLTRYLINDQEIFPGQRLIFPTQNINVTVARQDKTGYRAPINSVTAYKMNCPVDRKTEFDVSEIATLPTYNITTQTKGCSITYLGTDTAGHIL